MSIQFWAVEDYDADTHAEHVQNLLNQNWQIMSSHVTSIRDLMCYTTFMERDTTPKLNGLHTASVVEALEKRMTEVEERLEVVEATLDDDATADDLAAPTAWVERQMQDNRDLPDWYREAIDEAISEDDDEFPINGDYPEADDDEPQWEPYVPPTEAEKARLAQDAEAAKRDFFSDLARLDQEREGGAK